VDLTHAWKVPAFLDFVHEALTTEAVSHATSLLGVRLPDSYLELLRIQNGGYARATWSELPHRRFDGIGATFPSITLPTWFQGDDVPEEMWVPNSPEPLVSFDGEGHWDLCLDYRSVGSDGEPTISYIDTELETDDAVAPSFTAFLSRLVDQTEETAVRIHHGLDLDVFAAAFGTTVGCPVEDLGSWDHGYRTLRVDLAQGPHWAWITPNRVPAGFRRDGRTVIATAETAMRLPMDPECSVLLTCTDADVDEVRSAARATGFWHG
jgi:hypothetical protein